MSPELEVPTSIELRMRRFEARSQLTELISRYCVALDDRDFVALKRLFAEDAQFNAIRGRDAILNLFRKQTASFGPCYHYAHAHHFDFDSDESAAGTVNGHAEVAFKGETMWMGLRYLDRYACTGGRWYFQSRTLKVRYALPFTEMGTLYGDALRQRWPGAKPRAADIPDTLDTYIASRTDSIR